MAKFPFGIESLGAETLLMIIAMEGRVERRDGYWMATWPQLPDFYWGNLLVFDRAPVPGDFDRWMTYWNTEFGGVEGINHVSIAWEEPSGKQGDIDPFLEVGFKPVLGTVQVARKITAPPRPNRAVHIQPMRNCDWDSMVQMTLAFRPQSIPERDFTDYMSRWLKRYRFLTEAGHGQWFGAYLNDRLVAGCGIMIAGGLGRYQEVVTHPDFRQQGIASELVSQAGQIALKELGVHTLVIAADADSSASRIYASVGLAPIQFEVGAFRRPQGV